MVKYIIKVLLLLVFLGVSTGCGPVVSGLKIMRADIRLSEAETAGAKTHALYSYASAQEYLKKAREEHAYSEFWTARKYAQKALDYAQEALEKCEIGNTTEQIGTDTPE